MHAIDADGFEQFQLLAQTGQPRRRLLRRKELARMRLEDHRRRLQTEPNRRRAQLTQQCPMAEMHPVEITDGESDRLCAWRIKSA
ncbi:hypothetical protein FGKAn22_08690 [Ferrigenium kumadai]|uniref:Uncharacterized protein n=1 Tax=Ferrigenium kumadai TaxID=1682490 RepID=A0AAN1SZ01_9PROT|nr:hypothetical protein FGKAn22_08690 [Ferrigenium kumadai]